MNYCYPTDDERLHIPKRIIHGTTSLSLPSFIANGIQAGGVDFGGVPRLPRSLDFGEGFYCSYDEAICRAQVEELAKTRAGGYENCQPLILDIRVDQTINFDQSLKCLFFDETHGLDLARYIVHHRALLTCNVDPCRIHPDIIIGPVADGKVSLHAYKVISREITIEEFFDNISKADWFPAYRQIVFGPRAVKYLKIAGVKKVV